MLDGYFGHNNALQMAKQCKLHLISKLRTDAALHLPPTTPYAGKGRPRIYGERLDPRQIDAKYCLYRRGAMYQIARLRTWFAFSRRT